MMKTLELKADLPSSMVYQDTDGDYYIEFKEGKDENENTEPKQITTD
jgi:hypothetical protein